VLRSWVGEEALAIGVYCAVVASSFAECIELAANHDGDSDSTASIAGQLYGARQGLGPLPREAVERIDVREALMEVWGEWMQPQARRSAAELAAGLARLRTMVNEPVR
jgi:ADP-ribosylglycohydrolase